MAKFDVDCFTEKSLPEPGFPENSYEAATVLEAAAIIHNCTRKTAGIKMVQVWIREPDDREPVKKIRACHCGTKKVSPEQGAEIVPKPEGLPHRPGTK